MKYSRCTDINAIVASLVRNGWTFHQGKRHGKLQAPLGKQALTVPCSPSDHRAWLNFRRDVRHMRRASLP